ncbi:cupin domain-containing protein [Comamonas nitrativorans]|uniref:Cupin domain-containing protein n=1 Tax=Comamonas nitrativorans TaxID=108437 RepID=A0ABV9H293_9BURK
MNPILIRIENDDAFGPATPVGAPCGTPVAHTRTAGHQTLTVGSSAGLWECSPGRFRRQVAQAEYSYFISGEGCFIPDGGTPIAFRAGDSMYFPANTEGEWHVRQTVRKAYLIMAAEP